MGKPVMVVEDDPDLREILGSLLEEEGYTVVCAANGQEALQLLRDQGVRPCVILLDFMMPIMDGRRFREEQLQDPALRDIPVIVLTAAGSHLSAVVQATGVLHKPLQIESVLEVVARYC